MSAIFWKSFRETCWNRIERHWFEYLKWNAMKFYSMTEMRMFACWNLSDLIMLVFRLLPPVHKSSFNYSGKFIPKIKAVWRGSEERWKEAVKLLSPECSQWGLRGLLFTHQTKGVEQSPTAIGYCFYVIFRWIKGL